MRNPLRSPVFAIIQNEVLLASKRIAPYALMTLFAANALLWWGQGPAVRLGWATNSDYYIVRNLQGFSFLLGLPIFNAIIMGDPVIRDFRLGIDPLIFSKPINRVQYLLGKFLGSFLVLVCCQAAFPLTLLVLQAFRTSQMIVQPVRVFPYFKHFFFFVVISHLVLAAVYFTVGTLTRNSKIVYGLAACFYPLYISYQVFLLKGLSLRWRILLDPMMLNSGPGGGGFKYSADFLNRYVVSYTGDMIANRLLVILVTAVSLAILYLRFRISGRSLGVEKFSMLSLSTATERVCKNLFCDCGTECDLFGGRCADSQRLTSGSQPYLCCDHRRLRGTFLFVHARS
jgi:ABC-2 type transport system permease protein